MVDTEQPEYSKQFLKILWEYQLFRVFETERLRKVCVAKSIRNANTNESPNLLIATTLWQFLVILHWYACGVDGRADVRSRDYQNF